MEGIDVPFARVFFDIQTDTPLAARESDADLPPGGPRTPEAAREDTRISSQVARSGSRIPRVCTLWEPTEASRDLANRFYDMERSDYSGRCQICGNTFMKPDDELQVFVVHVAPPSADDRTHTISV